MHLFDGKNVILRPKSGLAFKLIPWLATFYLGPTPVFVFGIEMQMGFI
jgi:hypothetical protein